MIVQGTSKLVELQPQCNKSLGQWNSEMQLLCFDLLALPWYCEVTKSDKKCKAFQNEQICSFDRKERQILFTICRHLWRTPSMRRRNVKNKMEELTHLKRSSNCDSILLEDCRPISSIPPSAAFQTWKWYDWRILNCYNINFKRINFQTLSGFQLCAGMVGCHHLNYFYTRPSWILNVWPNHQEWIFFYKLNTSFSKIQVK